MCGIENDVSGLGNNMYNNAEQLDAPSAPHWEAKRTIAWKLSNIPPIIFRLVFFALVIYLSKDVWLIDISDLKIEYRSSYLLMRIISFLCAIWIVDCLVRIHGFTSPKILLIYEIVKAIAILFCILFLTVIFTYMGYHGSGVLSYKGDHESDVWYFFSFIGILILLPIRKLRQLSHIIADYKITTVQDIDKIALSKTQKSIEAGNRARGIVYHNTSYIDYQIKVDDIICGSGHMLNSIVRYKFADYKNGKPLRVIYSTKNPKFNIIFQD